MSSSPEPRPEMPASPFALMEDMWEQFRQIERELDQIVWDEAQARRRGEELQARLDQLQQNFNELQAQARASEKAAREARLEADALRVRLGYAQDIVNNLNQSLTWCQNYAWQTMTRVRETMASPHHRLGRAFEVLTRDKAATFKAFFNWLLHRMTLRPYSVSKALAAPYETAEIRESLEILAFYAQNAKRELADTAVTTPASMAVAAPHAARRPRPDLIVYSITGWEFRRQRPQHLVGRLVARGSRAFVMPTDIPGLGEAHPSDAQILERMKVRLIEGEIWEVVPCAYNTLNIYKDSLSDPRDLAVLGRSLALLRDRFGIGRHVAVVQLPFWGPLALGLPGARVIYDCMDNHRDFSTNDPAMLEHEERLVAESDAVVVSSDFLDRAVGERPRAKALIRNGCEYDFFAAAPALIDPAVAGLKGPVIGYYGAISDWFDVELVEAVARRRPEWSFVLIGHTFGAKIEGLQVLPNVLFTGEVPYTSLTSYLYRFDVCMIPFKLTELILATNPVKIYEYAAAGKPTVATRIPEVERLGGLAEIADDATQFEAAIERLLAEPDPDARAERLRAFARENTWDARAEAFDTVLRRHLYPKVSVVVLSYKNWAVTRDCLASILEETTYPNFELIVVDNASDDETRAQLQALGDPRMKLQLNGTNLGYAGGNNAGVRLASGDILVLLNNDTVCPPDWIERILAPFAEDAKVGMVGPMTNSAGNEQMLDAVCQSGQDPRRWLAEFYRVRRGRRHETDRLGFFCVAIRREAWEQVGELDAGFEVGFFEDDDYCARVAEAGWKLVVAEDAFVYHHGSASFNKLDRGERQAIEEKNRARFEAKHGRPWQPPICEYLHYGAEGPGHEARPVAVVAPCLDWNAGAERPQQVALALARSGWLVYYVTNNMKQDRYPGIRLLRPFLYVMDNAAQWIEEVAAQPVAMLLSFGPGERALAAPVGAKRVVLDLAGARPWAWRAEDERFAEEAENAQLITVAGPELLEALPATLRGKARVLRGGVDAGAWTGERPAAPPVRLGEIIQRGGPVIVVYGAEAGGCDWAWLEALARARREWAFVAVESGEHGGNGVTPEFFNLRNVYRFEGVHHGDLAQWLAFADAGVVAPGGDPAAAREAALTLISAGLPVVAGGRFEDLEFEGLVQGAAEAGAAAEALATSLGKKVDAAFQRRCGEYARRFDWEKMVAPLIDIVKKSSS